jgi:hypothetical protein
LGTVLANEEVIDGLSERGGHPVIRKVISYFSYIYPKIVVLFTIPVKYFGDSKGYILKGYIHSICDNILDIAAHASMDAENNKVCRSVD